MSRTYKEQGMRSARGRHADSHEREADEIATEYKSRLRRHDMVEFSDLYLNHDDEIRQERGMDW